MKLSAVVLVIGLAAMALAEPPELGSTIDWQSAGNVINLPSGGKAATIGNYVVTTNSSDIIVSWSKLDCQGGSVTSDQNGIYCNGIAVFRIRPTPTPGS